jgi:hypothetical protein
MVMVSGNHYHSFMDYGSKGSDIHGITSSDYSIVYPIYKYITKRKAVLRKRQGLYDELPEWQHATDSDIFEAIERSALQEAA